MLSRNPQRQGNLQGPLVIVAQGPAELFVVKMGNEEDPNADAQMYELDTESMLNQIKPLAIWLKFMYNLQQVSPAIPFDEEERQKRVLAYQLAKKAREASSQ